MTYKIKFHEEALKEFLNLDGSVQKLVAKQISKLETSPELGELLGNKNGIDLTNYRKMYADQKKVRIVYEILDKEILVHIVAIGKRDEMEVYKSALARVK